MRIPSGVWLFSNNAATMRGKANALPFNVWAIEVFWSLLEITQLQAMA
jgi:hypothetical protein